MTEIFMLFIVWGAGFLLGVIFFGGLWWTVGKILPARHPTLLFFISLLLRTSIVLCGFYTATSGQWSRFPVCLLGFVIARFFVIRLTASLPIGCRTPVEDGPSCT